MFRIQKILLVLVAAGVLHGQTTQLDLHFQSRDVDFSTANATQTLQVRHDVSVRLCSR